MSRRFLFLAVGLLGIPSSVLAQNAAANDPTAVAFAALSIAALTGGNSVGDVTLDANVTSPLADTFETGTATFKAKGFGKSRVDVTFSRTTRADVRNIATTAGGPGGAWKENGVASTAYSRHNCWTDASWFFPALSSLSQTANPTFVFRYVGQEIHADVNTEHIKTFQLSALQKLSTMDFYLDPVSYLPVAVAFNLHPDNDMNTNVATEIRFDNYQPSGGSRVPFHFQKLVNGNVTLDATVTAVSFNAGLTDSIFILH